jgi:hypothetical protein
MDYLLASLGMIGGRLVACQLDGVPHQVSARSTWWSAAILSAWLGVPARYGVQDRHGPLEAARAAIAQMTEAVKAKAIELDVFSFPELSRPRRFAVRCMPSIDSDRTTAQTGTCQRWELGW